MALVSRARYRELTGDLSNYDAIVDRALVDAQETLETALRRPLESAARTETIEVFPDGYLYPLATPITVAPSGYALVGTTRLGGPASSPVWGWPLSGTVTLTYTGGWSSSTVPSAIERAICRTAQAQMTPNDRAGVKAVTVGDLSVTYDPTDSGELPSGVWDSVKKYRRKVLVSG